MTTSIPAPVARKVDSSLAAYYHKGTSVEYQTSVRTPKTLKKVSFLTSVQRRDALVEAISGRKPSPCEIIHTQWTVTVETLHDGEFGLSYPKVHFFDTEEDATVWAKDAAKKAMARAYARQTRQRQSGQHRQ